MAFQRPTLAELIDRSQQDFVSRLSSAGAVLRRASVAVFARVVAGAAHMLHGHLEYLSRQVFPDQSDDAFLVRQAALFGLSKNPAAFAAGTVTVTGTNGTLVPAGTLLLRGDGSEYSTDADVTIASGTAAPAVTASLAGAAGTLVVGEAVSFESPIAGVNATATVATSTQDGSDEETVADLRTRLLERLRQPPQGGAATDYVAWAKEVAGVTRAWVYPGELGAGTVTVRFTRDDDAASIIPDAGEIAAVQAHIDEVRPVTAAVTVVAPVAVALDPEIGITPDTAETRAAVEAELQDLLRRTAEPGGTILLSQIEVAVGIAEGVENFYINLPPADVTLATGQIAVLGTIAWA
jgi:uncharacterized phage protein gp47/JayE